MRREPVPFFSFRVCERSLHEIKGFGLPLHGINPFAHGIGGCGFRIHPQPPIPCSLTSMNPHPACKTPDQTRAFDSRVWMRRPYLPISCKMPSNTRAGRPYSSTGLCFVHTPGIRSTHRPPRKRACDEKEKRGLADFQITTASCRLSSQMRRRVCLFSHLHEMESYKRRRVSARGCAAWGMWWARKALSQHFVALPDAREGAASALRSPSGRFRLLEKHFVATSDV